jgi:hypothetical protein
LCLPFSKLNWNCKILTLQLLVTNFPAYYGSISFGQKSIGLTPFSWCAMATALAWNVRTSNVTLNWGDGS